MSDREDFFNYQGRGPRRLDKAEWLAENGFKIIAGLIALMIVTMIAGGIIWFAVGGNKVHTKTLTINDKAVVTDCDRDNGCSHTYMIYTDEGTFKDTDTLLHKKFNSSDLYGKLKVGQTYTCKYYGFRFHITSTYPNLISCEAS